MRAGYILAFVSILLFSSLSYAQYGYGTSTVTVNQSSVTLNAGASAQVSYSVNLASGNTWVTNFVINNQAQLSSQGITPSASKSSGDPTFSGVLAITVSSSTKAGSYTIALSATGDDPSTSNTNVTLNVMAPATATIKQNSTNTTAATTAPTTAASTTLPATVYTTVNYYNSTSSYPSYSLGKLAPFLIAAIIIILVGALAETRKKSPASRLVILGVVLILLGIVVWLYGDYSGGNFTYIWSGVALIIIGTLVWLFGDHKGMLI